MSNAARTIEVFPNCPRRTIKEIQNIYEFSQHNIFADTNALQFLKTFIEGHHIGSLTDQYLRLHQQFEELLSHANLANTLSVDDLDDLDGLPKTLEDSLYAAISSKDSGAEKDRKLRLCVEGIQEALRTDIALTREYKLFQHGLKKALTSL